MQLTLRQRGVAMLYALLLMVVIMGVATLMFARTIGEVQHSADDAGIVQSLMLARGAANLGGSLLQGPVKNDLATIIKAQSTITGRWAFGSGLGDYPTPQSVNQALVTDSGSVADQLQTSIDTSLCTGGAPSAPREVNPSGGGAAAVVIFVTGSSACGSLPSGVDLPAAHFVDGQPRQGTSNDKQTYAIPFVLVAQGTIGKYKRNVVAQGEYRFTVGRQSFATYALFTNKHTTASGGDVWFTENTLFDGPVHTNQYFRFYHNPWFGGEVTSAGCSNPSSSSCSQDRPGAEFYSLGFKSYPGQNPSYNTRRYGVQAPELTQGVNWTSPYVALPPNQDSQKTAAQNGGLYLGGDASKVKMWAADSSGAPLTQSGSSWSGPATYQYIQTCNQVAGHYERQGRHWVWVPPSGGCTTYRYDSSMNLQVDDGSGSWSTYSDPTTGAQAAPFNGVVYVDGSIDRVTGPDRVGSNQSDPDTAPPALTSFAQVTLASANSMTVTGDLKYEDPPCTGELGRDSSGNVTTANCNNLNAQNVLGLYAQNGDVLIGNNNSDSTLNAPENVRIDGVLMSATGVVGVQSYDSGSVRGDVHLLGGVIENNYGAFGTFDPSTGQNATGYSRKFTYDQRMAQGLAPPYFPTVGGDELKNVVLFSYGQREQVY